MYSHREARILYTLSHSRHLKRRKGGEHLQSAFHEALCHAGALPISSSEHYTALWDFYG